MEQSENLKRRKEVRKIISILVAMGLMLSMAVVAAPATAQTCTATVDLNDDCAGHVTFYTVNFTSPVTLLAGNDLLSFDFGAGTTFGTFADGDITVSPDGAGPFNVLAATIVIDGTHLEFLLPVGASIDAGDEVIVVIDGVKNPAGGDYVLQLDYDPACCDPVVFDCAEYTIKPAYSSYKFTVDFDNTYPGIAEDFVPPFKACGQEEFDVYVEAEDFYATNFTLTFAPEVLGCEAPCANATMWFVPTVIPEGEEVWLSFNGTPIAFDHTAEGTEFDLPNIDPLEADTTLTWELLLHFSSPGDYQICFYVECPIPVDCGEDDTVTWYRCLDFTVHQWKLAWPIDLYHKWNLISVPFQLFDPAIDDVLAAIDDPAGEILSIWHFDQCVDDWFAWGNGFDTLATIDDGKGYWLRVEYDNATPGKEAGAFFGTLWVWGTTKPQEYPGAPPTPLGPYDVCEGWNMIGPAGDVVWWVGSIADATYLYNWFNWLAQPEYGMVYWWMPGAQDWNWFAPATGFFWAGDGYWVTFDHDGQVYAQ
jgi:hypothetical protein